MLYCILNKYSKLIFFLMFMITRSTQNIFFKKKTWIRANVKEQSRK